MSFDTPEVEEQFTPTLRAIVDAYGSSVTADYKDWRCMSVKDTFGLEPSAFMCNGEDIIEAAQAVASCPSSSVLKSEELEPAGSTSSPFFKPKRFKSKIFEPQQETEGTSAKSIEKRELKAAAVSALQLMDSACRERFLAGVSELPPTDAEKVLLASIEGLAGTSFLKGAVSAVVRIRDWHLRFFGSAFPISAARVAWYMFTHLVPDGDVGHVSQSFKDGLIFASNKLKLDIDIPNSVRALAKPPRKAPKQAPSASCRAVRHFWEVAQNKKYSRELRRVSAGFYVKSVCALRGIDAQRSAFDQKFGAEGSGFRYFTAVAYDSKSKMSMPWACPMVAFDGDTSWSEPLLEGWTQDFIFPSRGRGHSLVQGCVFTDEPASPYIILTYLREILMLPSVSLPPEEAKLMRRHSMRHWIANAVRILRFPLSDAFQGGRWKEMAVMPLRYSQETKFVAVVDVILRVLERCEEAFVRTPPQEWPVFGGWELLLSAGRVGSATEEGATFQEDLFVTPAEDEQGGDSSGDEAEVEPAPAKPSERAPVRAVARRPKDLPEGWTVSEHFLLSGRAIPTYFGPKGEKKRSLKQAWESFYAAQQARSRAGARECFKVGDNVCVWWPGDGCYYDAEVLEMSDSELGLARVKYSDDGERLWHDFSVEEWKFSSGPEAEPDVGSASGRPAQESVETQVAPAVETAAKLPLFVRSLATTWKDGSPSAFQPAPDGSKRGRT